MGDPVGRRAVDIRPPADHVRRSVLANGVRVLTDHVDGATSATFAVWVGVGGRDEPLITAGSSHFLEHLLFKGTSTRTALQIALEMDGVGGDMNAYTSSEHTAYFAKVPSTEAEVALDVLLDVVADPVLTERDMEGERDVILSELASADDDPEDLAGVRLYEALFPDHSLGRDVLGTADTIASLTREQVVGFFEEWYTPTNLVVTAAGNVDHERLVAAVGDRMGARPVGRVPTREAPPAGVVTEVFEERPLEMVQLALGWRGIGASDPDRHALAVLNHILGTGPSSRLFQHVREEMGLVYAVGSSVSQFTDVGAFSVQCATAPENAGQVVELIRADVERLRAEGISQGELLRTKRALRGALLLGLEDSGSRAARLGVAEVLRGGVTPLDVHLEALDLVTTDDVLRVASRVFDSASTLVAVGPGNLEGDLGGR